MKKSLSLSLIAIIFFCSLLARAQRDTTDLVPKSDKLLNGLPVLVLERPGSGSVVLHLVIKSGATFDTLGKAGLADLTAQMLLRGAGGWSAERLKEELNDIGARLEITTGWDSTEVRLLGRSTNIESLIELLGRIVTQPKFRDQDFEQLKAERVKELNIPPTAAVAADEAFYAALYGSHPYNHSVTGTKESVAQVNHYDLNDFYERFYLANNAALIIVGEVSAERIVPLLRKALGGWRKGEVVPYTFVPPKANAGINIRLIERADQSTAEIRLGSFALRRIDTDYLPMQVLINILNRRLSARGGYKLQAALVARKLRGPFLLSASVPSKEAADAITAAIAEIKKLGDGIEPAELQAAKDRIVEEYKEGLNTNTELASRWAELENYDLGAAYIKNFISQVGRISVEDLRRVNGKYMSTDNLTIAVLGRASELETDLKKLGKLEVARGQGSGVRDQ